jgi:hypothetical protein
VVLSVLGLGTLGGCVPGLSSPEAPPPPPGPLPWPVAAVEHPVFDTLPSPAQLPPPVVEAARDELLESSVRRDPAFEEAVEWWVRYWRGPASGWFPDFLARMARLGQVVDSALAREGLPASLRYLPLIESGYNPLATSPVRAAGLWQFMAPTAREFGMEVTPLLDERRDPFKSTEAALRYLGELGALRLVVPGAGRVQLGPRAGEPRAQAACPTRPALGQPLLGVAGALSAGDPRVHSQALWSHARRAGSGGARLHASSA